MTVTATATDLLTNDEAATLLGLQPNTLEIWRLKGKGPRFVKMGHAKQAPIRYFRSEIDAWLKANTFASTSAYSPAARAYAKSAR